MAMTASDLVLQAVQQMLLKCRQDPVTFSTQLLDVVPHPGQERWLRNSTQPQNILVTGNRWGKSEAAAIDLVYACITQYGWSDETALLMNSRHEPYGVANVSVTQDMANLVWSKARRMLQNPKVSWLVKDVRYSPYPRITFINDSFFEARATANKGEHLLGHTFALINWDEAAYEPYFEYIRDNVLVMRLVDRGGILKYTSTGNGRNAFGQYYLDALAGKLLNMYAQTGNSFENPYVDHKRLNALQLQLPEHKRRQNISGEIVDVGGDYFMAEDLQQAIHPALTDMLRILAWDEDAQAAHEAYAMLYSSENTPWFQQYPMHQYVHGWDLARKRDYVVGLTFDVTTRPHSLVEFERYRKRPWAFTIRRIEDRHRRYRGRTYFDGTGVGDVVGDLLDKSIKAEGIVFTQRSKQGMLENWSNLINLRRVAWPYIKAFVDEHTFYRAEDIGLDTDCVMAACIAGTGMRNIISSTATPAAVNVGAAR